MKTTGGVSYLATNPPMPEQYAYTGHSNMKIVTQLDHTISLTRGPPLDGDNNKGLELYSYTKPRGIRYPYTLS